MTTVSLSPAEVVRRAETAGLVSAAATQVVALCQDEDATIGEVVELLLQDPALAARVLRQANSPMFGMPRRVSDVATAVRVLGLRGTRDAMLAATMGKMAEALGPVGTRLMGHTQQVSLAARHLSAAVPGVTSAEGATAGLLHDFGLLLLLALEPGQQARMEHAFDDGSLCDREMSDLGFTHAEVGAQLLLRWGLPSDLVRAVQSHHEKVTPNRIAATVQLAEQAVRAIELGASSVDAVIEGLDSDLLECFTVRQRLAGAIAALLDASAD